MKTFLFCMLAIVLGLSFLNVNGALAGVAAGQVVTCPGGDPIPEFPVTIYINGSLVDTVEADANGTWTFDISGDCDATLTAVLGYIGVHSPYDEAYCPLGRHGSSPACCVQVAGTVPCSGNMGLGDLELRCGIPGAPPCPSQ